MWKLRRDFDYCSCCCALGSARSATSGVLPSFGRHINAHLLHSLSSTAHPACSCGSSCAPRVGLCEREREPADAVSFCGLLCLYPPLCKCFFRCATPIKMLQFRVPRFCVSYCVFVIVIVIFCFLFQLMGLKTDLAAARAEHGADKQAMKETADAERCEGEERRERPK